MRVLSHSRITAFLGVFFGIVLTTNLFLLNTESSNPLTLTWGILSIVITIANISYIVWNIQEAKILEMSEDPYAKKSDNLESRIFFIAYFLFFVSFAMLFLVFAVGKSELRNYYQLEHATKLLVAYEAFLTEKSFWINVLALLNILVFFHILYATVVLTGSQNAIRYYIYTSASALILISFLILNQFKVIASVFRGNASLFSFDAWNDSIAKYLAISAIVLMIIMSLANHYRLKNLLLMTGSVLLVLVALQTNAAGQSFREYKTISRYFHGRCNIELG